MKFVHFQGTAEKIHVGKIVCIGRNYAEHAKEMKADLPDVPMFFLKPSTALLPDGGEIVIPTISSDMHHEVELVVLIGTGGSSIPAEHALKHVAGYGIGLDMTLRDVQAEAKKKGNPWTLAKGFDTSAPVSDFLPADLVSDPNALDILLKVNGQVRQSSNTSDFIFTVQQLIAYVSRFISFEAGDLIYTGTPEGVGPVRHGDTLAASLSARTTILASLEVSVR